MATPHPMTLPREGTTLLIVDVQERPRVSAIRSAS